MHINGKNFPFSYTAIRNDLVAHLYGFAHEIDMTVSAGGGARMLGMPDSCHLDWPPYEQFDLSPFLSESFLKSVHRFVQYGEQDHYTYSNDEEDEELGRLEGILRHGGAAKCTGYFEEVVDERKRPGLELGGLRELVDAVLARMKLDSDSESLDLDELAILANVDRRSVNNALYATGESRLNAIKTGHGSHHVEPAEARRWLRRRPGFRPTVMCLRRGPLAVPDAIDREALPGYLRKRLDEMHGRRVDPESVERGDPQKAVGSGTERAAKRAALEPARLDALIGGNTPFTSAEVIQVADMLALDAKWFAQQLGMAPIPFSPLDMDTMNTTTPILADSPLNETATVLETTLTAAGIRNGYIDFEVRFASRFFPADAFGTRVTDEKGQPVDFIFDGRQEATDIRLKSKVTASPRLRFNGWFKAQQAQAGDRVRFERTGERRYTLTFVPAGR